MQGVLLDEEDRMLLKGTRNGSSSMKFLYETLDPRSAVPFLDSIIHSSCVHTEVDFFPL